MTKFISATAIALITATTLSACVTGGSHDSVEFADGWVRVSEYSDHVGGMTGAFAEIHNATAADVTIVGGSAEIAGMVEAHEVAMVGGKMMMQKKEGGIVIPAGETITLEPGGLHIMLMDLKKPIAVGDEITLTLDLEGAEDVTFTWPARESAAGDEEYNKN